MKSGQGNADLGHFGKATWNLREHGKELSPFVPEQARAN
jgi:hypothetical protein